MKKAFKFLTFMGLIVLIAGVVGYQQFFMTDYSVNSISRSGKSISEVFQGTISVLGSSNAIRVQSGSVVDSITLAGNDNTITIDPGADVRQIRGAGSRNRIQAPDGLEIDLTLLKGQDNQRTSAGSRQTLDGL